MTKEEVLNIAFQIIGFAGEAFSDYEEATNKAEAHDFEKAKELMKIGKEQLLSAHRAQTKLLTAEAKGEDIPFSLTMVHAQDHLMRAVLMETLANHFIQIEKQSIK